MAEVSLPEVAARPAARARRAESRLAFSAPAIVLFGLASIALFFLAWFVPSPRLWSPEVSTALAWGFFAAHLLFARRHLGACDPGIWIAVNMLLNYFGMVLAVGLAPDQLDYDPFRLGIPPRLNQSFVVALLTLVSFLFGMHLAGWMRAQRPADAWPAGARPIARAAWATWLLGTGMVLVGIPIAGPGVLFGSYGDFKVAVKFAEADVRFFGTGFLIVQSGVFALIASADRSRPWRLRTGLLSALALALLSVSTGTRAALMTIALGAGWAFTQRVRPLSHWAAVGGFVIAFLVMPILGEFREFREVERSSDFEVSELAAANFYDMGSSLVAFSYTLEHIPRDKPYDWGLSVVSQLIDNIPNLGLSPGRFFGLDAVKHNPSKWLVATANPSKWQNFAGGYGYAVGAEWYFNFGMPGVLVGMALLGFAMNWLRNRSRQSPLWLTFASLALIMGVSMVRNDFGYPFRQLLWPGAALLFFVFLLPTRSARAAPGAPRA